VLMTRYLLNYIVRSGLSSNFFSIFCCFWLFLLHICF
jgi:hypothetical protein